MGAQAAQRYIAKITLGAHLPGNGMGGSTNPGTTITTPATNPTTGYWGGNWGIWNAASLKQATACGGVSSQMPQAPCAAGTQCANGALTTDTSLKMNGGLACSKLTTAARAIAGTAASNTATFGTVMPEVKMSGSGTGVGNCAATTDMPGKQTPGNCAGTNALPYTVALTEGYLANNAAKNGGPTNDQIKKATRGLPQTAVLGADFDKSTPTACIGPSVIFNDVLNSGINTGETTTNSIPAGKGVALRDPFGYVPAIGAFGGEPASQADGPVPSAAATYTTNKRYYQGVNAGQDGVSLDLTKFWDPITAAQASGGAFCCGALYYGTDGLGRGIPTNDQPIVAVTKNSAFLPTPLIGAAMEREIVPGGVCTGEAAFYAVLAPSQYVLPKVNSVATTQAANEARQKKCSETITNMLRMNRVSAGTSTSAATCDANALAIPGVSTDVCTGTGYSAVEYPLWMVGIGGGTTPTNYAVPNGYCYANACLENFAAVGTAATFDGAAKLSTLQSSPDMSTNPSATTGNSCGRAN